MHEFLLIAALIVSLIGLIGAFVRPVPGPAFSYVAIWLAYWCEYCYVTVDMLWIYLIVTIVVVAINFFVPQQVRQNIGGSRKAELGATISTVFVSALLLLSCCSPKYDLISFNLIADKKLFLIGMFVISLLGAFIGELADRQKNPRKLFLNTIGSALSFYLGTGCKFIFAFYVAFYITLDFVIYYH